MKIKLLLFLLINLATNSPRPDRTAYDIDVPAVVPIVRTRENGQKVNACTATVIAKDTLLTAAHCVDEEIVSVLIEGEERPFRLILSGEPGTESDFAMLTGNTGAIIPIDMANEMPGAGESCYWVGFAGTDQESIVPCTIVDEQGLIWGRVMPGDSGSALIVGGKVVGVVWALNLYAPMIGYVVPIETVWSFILPPQEPE